MLNKFKYTAFLATSPFGSLCYGTEMLSNMRAIHKSRFLLCIERFTLQSTNSSILYKTIIIVTLIQYELEAVSLFCLEFEPVAIFNQLINSISMYILICIRIPRNEYQSNMVYQTKTKLYKVK